MTDILKEQIVNDINDNAIILFMKGTKEMPMCGFSSTVVKVFQCMILIIKMLIF